MVHPLGGRFSERNSSVTIGALAERVADVREGRV
jgi:hypothetical protein